MKIKEYFNRLPNYLSANFFALLGFTNFVYPILAAMVTFFMIYVVGSNDALISRNIPNTLLCEILFFIPIICVLSIFSIITLFFFLLFPKYKIRTQITILILVFMIVYLINPIYKGFYFAQGNAIYFAFVPYFGLPLVILAIITYFILLILDLRHKSLIKNRELVENKYYKIYVNVFYHYFVLTLVISFFVLFYLFIFKLN